MKLQSQISRKYKKKEYKKFWIVIPKKLLEEIRWDAGQELKGEVKNNKLILRKVG